MGSGMMATLSPEAMMSQPGFSNDLHDHSRLVPWPATIALASFE